MPLLQDQIATDLRHQICNGLWPVGAELPSLNVLKSEYGVADKTIRAALRILHVEGYINVRQGALARVNPHSLWPGAVLPQLPDGPPPPQSPPGARPHNLHDRVSISMPLTGDCSVSLTLTRRLTAQEFADFAAMIAPLVTDTRIQPETEIETEIETQIETGS